MTRAARPGVTTVGDVVTGHLCEQVDELVACEPAALAGDPEGVHRMRVAARRLRSALDTFRPVLAEGSTHDVRGELRWLGSALAAARDAQVQHRRLVDLAASLGGRTSDAARQHLDAELRARCDRACADLAAAVGSERYRLLVARLGTLAADPPLSAAAARPAARALPGFVRRAARRVDRRAVAAGTARTAAGRATRLHEVRKAAKRARYAAETASPVLGKPARRVGKRFRRVQDVLGEHQDSVAARALLLDLRSGVPEDTELGAALGLLHGEERRTGRAAGHAYPDELRAATRAARRLRRPGGR